MAVALAEAGADIVGVSAILEPSGSEFEREVQALGSKFKAYARDFSRRDALYEFIRGVKAEPPDRTSSSTTPERFAEIPRCNTALTMGTSSLQ